MPWPLEQQSCLGISLTKEASGLAPDAYGSLLQNSASSSSLLSTTATLRPSSPPVPPVASVAPVAPSAPGRVPRVLAQAGHVVSAPEAVMAHAVERHPQPSLAAPPEHSEVPPEAEPKPKPDTEAHADVCGELRVRALSGEVLATFPAASSTWSVRELRAQLWSVWQPPAGHAYHLRSGSEDLSGRCCIRDWLDPTQREGAELQLLMIPIPEDEFESVRRSKELIRDMHIDTLHAISSLVPPDAGLRMLQAVSVSLDSIEVPSNWQDLCTALWSDAQSTKQKLLDFDIRAVNQLELFEAMKPFVEHERFNTDEMEADSAAFSPLCNWCISIYQCAKVLSSFIAGVS